VFIIVSSYFDRSLNLLHRLQLHRLQLLHKIIHHLDVAVTSAPSNYNTYIIGGIIFCCCCCLMLLLLVVLMSGQSKPVNHSF
jgi:hypothetical protein